MMPPADVFFFFDDAMFIFADDDILRRVIFISLFSRFRHAIAEGAMPIFLHAIIAH